MSHSLFNLGSGPRCLLDQLADPRPFAGWRELRVDIDPACKPDIQTSLTDMRASIPDASADLVWCSHVIEHFHDHEVSEVLAECARILRPGGAAVIRVPDLAMVLRSIDENDLERPLYHSAVGPISALDVIYGHRASIAAGNRFMAHHTAFTEASLAGRLLESGFEEVRTQPGPAVEFCAVATKGSCHVQRQLDALLHHVTG